MIHFNAHLYNILTNGEALYLVDFSLALDKQYLAETKIFDFFKTNNYVVITNICDFLFDKILDENTSIQITGYYIWSNEGHH